MNSYLLVKPAITEKSLELANKQNVYTFVVDYRAHKNQIKEAVESTYDVSVLEVNTVMNQAESVRTGRKRTLTKTAKRKKAFVKIKEGQTIDIFDLSTEA